MTMRLSFYRALLRLYPSSFRAEYGDELTRAYAQATEGRGAVAAVLTGLGDVVPNALAAHWTILLQDLHYAFRAMRHAKGFAATVIAVTAIGVGANTATFSVADYVLLRPLPYPEPDRIVRLCEGPKNGGGWGCMNELSPANFRDAAAMSTKTRGWAAFTGAEANLVGPSGPVRIGGQLVTPGLFAALGARPYLGAVFDTADGGRSNAGTVVISNGLWRSQFGSDPQIVGKSVRMDGEPRTVLGVMPPEFNFPGANVQIWLPLIFAPTDYDNRGNTYVQAVGRLVPGATAEEAQREFEVIASRLATLYPATNAETGFSFFRQRDFVLPRYRTMLLALCGASLALLLLTGANLANLLLVRAAGRERELAVRSALGAGRERLVRQMLTESVLLALLGGAIGVGVALLAVPLLGTLVPNSQAFAGKPSLDLRALGIAAAFTALTGIGFGLLPAASVGGKTGFTALREGGRGGGGRRQRLRSALVTLEVAVSVVLLVSSTLLIRAVLKVQSVDTGFSSSGVLTMRTQLTGARSADTVARVAFYDRVLADVRALPGVRAAAYTSGLPMVLTGGITGIEIPGVAPANRRREGVSFRFVSSQFFDVMGIPMVKGRPIDETDRRGSGHAAVVSETFAEHYWPNDDPLGKEFGTRGVNYTVVGISRDIRVRGLERTSEPQMYGAAAQAGPLGGLYIPKDLVVKTDLGLAGVLGAIRGVMQRIDPEQPISNVSWLADVVGNQTADRRAQVRILAALAIVAVILTGIGIYGLLAFVVSQRTREIGVRLALGAEPGRVGRMIVGEAARFAAIGAAIGVVAAYAAARGMSALLFGVQPGDPIALSTGTLVVALVTLAGAVGPAFAAVRVSPLVAMRAE